MAETLSPTTDFVPSRAIRATSPDTTSRQATTPPRSSAVLRRDYTDLHGRHLPASAAAS
ncbi:MAG: hypothetical protein AB7G47_19770 [Mycolicibacterium sp.]|uniref:hypothetical protein n=1 Tax=Mycolicibacterium sp. TaxID=2320850 RepID=UPI003D0BC72B